VRGTNILTIHVLVTRQQAIQLPITQYPTSFMTAILLLHAYSLQSTLLLNLVNH